MPQELSEQISLYAILPRIERCEKDLDAVHSAIRDDRTELTAIILGHEDAKKRIEWLEKSVQDQRNENIKAHSDIESLKTSIQDLREKMISVVDGMGKIATKFDENSNDLKNLFVEQAAIAEKSIGRHAQLMKTFLTLSGSFAGVVIILTAIHASITGQTISATITSLITPFFKSMTGG